MMIYGLLIVLIKMNKATIFSLVYRLRLLTEYLVTSVYIYKLDTIKLQKCVLYKRVHAPYNRHSSKEFQLSLLSSFIS